MYLQHDRAAQSRTALCRVPVGACQAILLRQAVLSVAVVCVAVVCVTPSPAAPVVEFSSRRWRRSAGGRGPSSSMDFSPEARRRGVSARRSRSTRSHPRGRWRLLLGCCVAYSSAAAAAAAVSAAAAAPEAARRPDRPLRLRDAARGRGSRREKQPCGLWGYGSRRIRR